MGASLVGKVPLTKYLEKGLEKDCSSPVMIEWQVHGDSHRLGCVQDSLVVSGHRL
jgi:hypothetical protein